MIMVVQTSDSKYDEAEITLVGLVCHCATNRQDCSELLIPFEDMRIQGENGYMFVKKVGSKRWSRVELC